MKKLISILITVLIASTAFENANAQSEVKGYVSYNNKKETSLDGLTVTLYDESGKIYDQVISEKGGRYKFRNVADGTYIIDVSGYVQGATVDLSDARLLSKYLKGKMELTPLQLLAADVNENGQVNWGDYNEILLNYYQDKDRISEDKVVFIPEKVVVEYISTKAKKPSKKDSQRLASTLGNVDGVFLPTTKTIQDNFTIRYANKLNIIPNQLIDIPVYLSELSSFGGIALSMDYPNNAMDVEVVSSQLKNFDYRVNEGVVRIVSMDKDSDVTNFDQSEPLFLMKFRTHSDVDESEIKNISFNAESHIIDVNGLKLENVKMSLPSFANVGINELNNIYPNPIYKNATISYSLSSTYKVNLRIFNVVGQMVTNLVDEEQAPGNYEVILNISNLQLSAGCYIYRLECKGENAFVESKMMVVR